MLPPDSVTLFLVSVLSGAGEKFLDKRVGGSARLGSPDQLSSPETVSGQGLGSLHDNGPTRPSDPGSRFTVSAPGSTAGGVKWRVRGRSVAWRGAGGREDPAVTLAVGVKEYRLDGLDVHSAWSRP